MQVTKNAPAASQTHLPLLEVCRCHRSTEQPRRQLPKHQLVPRARTLNVPSALVVLHGKHVDLWSAAAERDDRPLQGPAGLCRQVLGIKPAHVSLPELYQGRHKGGERDVRDEQECCDRGDLRLFALDPDTPLNSPLVAHATQNPLIKTSFNVTRAQLAINMHEVSVDKTPCKDSQI